MRTRILSLGLVCLAACGPSNVLAQNMEQGQTTAVNALYAELGGKGGLYGIFYDRLITDRFGVGMGFSSWSFTFFSDINITVVPLFVSWYPLGETSRLYLDAGVDWVSADIKLAGAKGSGMIGVAGIGYTYRPHNAGLLFKIGPTLFVSGGGGQIWGNLSLGYAF